jgi:hypothetical protein
LKSFGFILNDGAHRLVPVSSLPYCAARAPHDTSPPRSGCCRPCATVTCHTYGPLPFLHQTPPPFSAIFIFPLPEQGLPSPPLLLNSILHNPDAPSCLRFDQSQKGMHTSLLRLSRHTSSPVTPQGGRDPSFSHPLVNSAAQHLVGKFTITDEPLAPSFSLRGSPLYRAPS